MKFRTLLLSFGIASFACVGWLMTNEWQDEVPAYVPRSEHNKASAGAEGAMEYYEMLRANVYTGEVELEDILRVQKAIEKSPPASAKNDDIQWMSMGPSNVGGRTRAILPLASNPNTLIAGGVSGGVFKSTDGGQNWEVLSDFDPYLIVSSLAQIGNGNIYCSTGNSRENLNGSGGSGFMGRGLFVSEDEGETWELVPGTEPDFYNTNSDWVNSDVIKADPNDPDRLWVGTNFGLYPLDDETRTLGDQPTGLLGQANVKDFDISSDGDRIIACVGSRLYVSNDGGETFEQPDSPALPSNFSGACEVAISRNNSDFMYVSLAQPNGFLEGIYATNNGGTTWYVIAPSSFDNGNIAQFAPFFNGLTAQGWYDNMITSVPTEDGTEQVIMGGIRMWRWNLVGTTPGITAWEEVNANFASFPGGPPSPIYVHSDIHTDAWDSNGNLWIGSDGGVFRSQNQGVTWTSLNKDYVTTQFYAMAFNPDGQLLGGTQDNGTLWLPLVDQNEGFGTRFTGGDGFDCEISQEFPDFMFSTIYNGAVFRSADRGETIFPMEDLISVSNGGGSDFTTDIALHENPNNANSEIFDEYIPALDSPYLEFLEDPEITDAGDTIIAKIPAGTEITIEADNSPFLLNYTTEEDINFYSYFVRVIEGEEFIYHDVADTAFIQETPQFLLAAALSNGVYVTRQPLKINGTPQFYQVAEPEPGASPTSVEWSPDGDHLYVGYSNGRLIRLSNFNDAWTEEELIFDEDEYALTRSVIHQGGGAVTDIEVDYSQGREENASERVVISIGGYGGAGKVRVSDNAASVAGIGSFDNVWNVPDEFVGMPVYSVVMDILDPNVLLAGTEYGVWYSGDNGETWSEANNGDMVRVPVFDLRQQKAAPWNVPNGGVVYAGSHGRGFFRTEFLFNSTDVDDLEAQLPQLDDITVFPNPVTGEAKVRFDLGTSTDIEMYIYTIDGRLVEAFQEQRVEAGFDRQISFDASDYAIGQYIVQLRVGDIWESGKFVVTR